MGRPATISYEDFRSAALELVAARQRVSFAAMRHKLGGGSYEVLRRYIDRFDQEQAAAALTTGDVSPTLQALANQARDDAMRQVRAELAADALELEREWDALASERAQAEQRVIRAQAEAQFERSRVAELQAECRELKSQLDTERHAVGQQREALARAEATLAASQAAHTAASAAWAQERAALASQFASELRAAVERLEGLQQHALRQVDELRTRHIDQVEQLLAKGLERTAAQVRVAVDAIADVPKRLVSTEQAASGAGKALQPLIEQLASAWSTELATASSQVRQHVDDVIGREAQLLQAQLANMLSKPEDGEAAPRSGASLE